MENKRLWIALGLVVSLSFALLLTVGSEIYRSAPPIPARVISESGEVLFTGDDIRNGQNAWQSTGGQQLGSIWGHGAYQAPDWSADWLHREATGLLDLWSKKRKVDGFENLPAFEKDGLKGELRTVLQKNTYDGLSGDLRVSDERALVIKDLTEYYSRLFSDAKELKSLRKAYAMKDNTLVDEARLHDLSAFFFWTAWSTAAHRPGSTISYTNDWPAEPLLDHKPTNDAYLWTFLSIFLLLAGVGALVWHMAIKNHDEVNRHEMPQQDPFSSLKITPSMKAVGKYFWTVIGLVLLQIGIGIITAHYGVEGQSFYGIPLANYLPYSLLRTWHTQLGIFWIATAWLATGLFIAPAVNGYEPRLQRFGVNLLWGCLLVIVLGSMTGQWFAIHQTLGYKLSFWFGHQGYEYVDLGRFWQIFLFAGLFIWLGLMLRALWPSLKRPSENRQLLSLFALSSGAIAIFYGAGLMWGQHTHLAVAEYWRWWVVHLWVEGFFEVFATCVIAFLFVRMGLLEGGRATKAVLFSTVIFLAGGILGTFHHLYFTGTPTSVLAVGAAFSALEIVPLVLIGFEAYGNYRVIRKDHWIQSYTWPIMFFTAVGFWNLVGAGLFGFLINPPVALYYMQGLNTTAVHGHTALFGVYGMLGIGLMLFCMRVRNKGRNWSDGWLKASFWLLNGGLTLMVFLSLLPIGLLQTRASISRGLWYARSAEFLNTPQMMALKWARVPGDIMFSLGMLCLAIFFVRLLLKRQRLPVAVERPVKDSNPLLRA